jgi:hypothetical protein
MKNNKVKEYQIYTNTVVSRYSKDIRLFLLPSLKIDFINYKSQKQYFVTFSFLIWQVIISKVVTNYTEDATM